MFNYVMVLVSIVIGLAITHLLQGVARIVQHPGREKTYWIHLVWVGATFLGAIFWWWWQFRLATQVWTFQLYGFVVAYAVLIFVRSAMLFPADLEGYDGYKDYYYSRRAWLFGLAVLQVVVDLVDTLLKGVAHFLSLGPIYMAASAAMLAGFTIAAFTRNELYHAVVALIFLAFQLFIALAYFGSMQ